jgi:hypothetical protein
MPRSRTSGRPRRAASLPPRGSSAGRGTRRARAVRLSRC